MAVWGFVNFFVPEAQRLADLTGVENDLATVQSYCVHLKRLGAANVPEELNLRLALCVAAIATYGRTTGSGVRSGIAFEQLERLSSDDRQTHQYFKDLRDKWVAHSVNAFEENHVVAHLVPEEGGPKGVCGISVQHRRVMGLSTHDIESLERLSKSLSAVVRTDIAAENERVLLLARSQPIDEMYARSDGPSPIIGRGRHDAGRPRTRYGES